MATTAQVTAGSLATIITSTDLAFDVFTANSSTGAVTSSYLSSRAKSYLTSELLRLITLDSTLTVAAAFQGLVQSLVSVDQLESSSFSISVSQVGSVATLSVSGLQATSHVTVSLPFSTSSPFAPPASVIPSILVGSGIHNIKAAPYNARGDGVADDTVAGQKFYTDMAAAGPGAWYVPDGTYNCSTTVSAVYGVVGAFHLYGDDGMVRGLNGGAIFRWTGANGGKLFKLRGMNNCLIENITWDGNSKADCSMHSC